MKKAWAWLLEGIEDGYWAGITGGARGFAGPAQMATVARKVAP